MSNVSQYLEDEPHEGGKFGTAILVVRKDIAEALANTDGDYITLIVDGFGRLHTITTPQTIANSIKVSPVGGEETVDASGTAQPLVGVSTDAQMLFVQAKTGNTGAVYFGDSTVDKISSKQTTLLQSQAVTVSADGGYKLDINEFFIDADNNDDGVDFLYL